MMGASGGWIEELLELVLRAVFGWLRGSDDNWWPYGCLLAGAGIVGSLVLIFLKNRH
jgi:hypothetical protein